MNTIKSGLLATITLVSLLAVSACEEQGPAEKTGEKVDNAVENLKDKYDEQTKGPMERTGQAIDESVDATKKKIEELGDKVEKKTDQ